MKITIEKNIQIYTTADGETPFLNWLNSLKDKTIRYRIKERLDRVALGNFGDHKSLRNGDGVLELRCNFGPGYRMYYGEDGDKIVLLLCGGDKTTQKKDIKKAISYWKDYLTR